MRIRKTRDEIDQRVDGLWVVIETGIGRQDHRTGACQPQHVFQVNHRQGGFARYQDQRAFFLDADIGGAFDPYADLRVFTGRVKRLKDFRQYATLRELCADPAIDGLIVTTPVHTHLDVMRERLVNDAVKALKLTKVIVAHRPETIASADRALVMDGGRIVQEVRPQQKPLEVVAAAV